MTLQAIDPEAAVLEIEVRFDRDCDFEVSQQSVAELEIPNWLDAPTACDRLLDPGGEGASFIFWELALRRRPTDDEFTTFAEQLRAIPGQSNLRLGLTEVPHSWRSHALGYAAHAHRGEEAQPQRALSLRQWSQVQTLLWTMKRWRTSTRVYVLLVVAALAAETIYAVNDNTNLQGHALAWLIIATVIFGIYRGLTRHRSA
jgi:hypothetical protein